MSAATGASTSRLGSIVGAANVWDDPASLAPYAIDGILPNSVVRPGSAAEAAEIVKFAAVERLALVPVGARTKVSMGAPPRKYNLALDLSRLNRIVAYDPGDLTLSVEAGAILADVATALGAHGQFLPLAVPFHRAATIGGTLASGIDSPLRQFYGTARDFVLGMDFITGDGTIAKSGARVVKNVTGYDLHKLMLGSFGTLGVMTQIHFRTFPAPRGLRAFVASFESSAQAWQMRHAVGDSPLRPLTLDILSPGVFELFGSAAASQWAPESYEAQTLSPGRWSLTAGFAGGEKILDRYAAELTRLAEHAAASETAILPEDRVAGAFGRKREFIPIALDVSPATVIMKLSALPSRMNGLLETAGNLFAAEGVAWAAIARGAGVAYLALLPKEASVQAGETFSRLTAQIIDATAAAEGNATIPWCPSAWKKGIRIWGADRAEFEQMKKLKAFFDPGGVMSPGRFVGGI
ncbi:MAG TPA: FAD-binding oxidoreductase [Candidatus Acidoferrum sp.]|nr:FAD-binding oxidoreductase [Candidatus Acidoferrum sp.]